MELTKIKNPVSGKYITILTNSKTRRDYGYNQLINDRLRKYKFINFSSFEKHMFSLNGMRRKYKFRFNVKWEDLDCVTVKRIGKFVIKMDCRKGRNRKYFVRFGDTIMKHFGDYIRHLQSGKITKNQHTKLFRFLNKESKKYGPLLNHNLDLPILHFKILRK